MTNENQAKVVGSNLPISTKHTIEISNFIRHMNIQQAKELLQRVIEKKQAIPFKRFNRDTGHRKGKIAAGRYPVSASKEILALLNSLESNAQDKGLNTNYLYLKTIIPNKASKTYHYGRQRGTKMKRTNIELIAEEREGKSKEKKEKTALQQIKEKPKKVEEKKPQEKQKEKKENKI